MSMFGVYFYMVLLTNEIAIKYDQCDVFDVFPSFMSNSQSGLDKSVGRRKEKARGGTIERRTSETGPGEFSFIV
jgi:hypothetical protein